MEAAKSSVRTDKPTGMGQRSKRGILFNFLGQYIRTSKIAPLTAATKKETPYTPVISAIWINVKKLYCEYPMIDHGKPVNA